MTPAEITDRVNKEASFQFPKIIEKTLLLMRQNHVRFGNKTQGKECCCPYCNRLQTYIKKKKEAHNLLKRIQYHEDAWCHHSFCNSPPLYLYQRYLESSVLAKELKQSRNEEKVRIL